MNELFAFWSMMFLMLFIVAVTLGLLIASLKLAFDNAGKIVLLFFILFVILMMSGA